MAHRAFYITQESLSVWTGGSTNPDEALVFADNDDGLSRFDAYLAQYPEQASFMLIDVIEEEFAPDDVPVLGLRDRKALINRRLRRRFPRTNYRQSVYVGKPTRDAEEALVVHSAVSNHELVDPWLQVILRHQTPLTGVFSVPHMASDLLKQFYKKTESALFITQHQDRKLRQVFLKDGQVLSARLSQSPAVTDSDYAEFVIHEIKRSRRYLERGRIISGKERLDVFLVADKGLAEKLHAAAEARSPMRLHFIDPAVAAKRLGVNPLSLRSRMETLYLASAYRRRPRRNYGVSGESRFWYMRRIRHAIIGAAGAASAVCSVLAGLFMSDAFLLQRQTSEIETQLVHLTETFRRENEQFDPIKADSHEMKLAVDTGDYLLSNRLPVPWVMQQVGLVMGDYPDIQIQELGWEAESVASEPVRRRGNEQMPVPVPAIAAVSADIRAEFVAFDGDMRNAFARIDALVNDLAEKTRFAQVVAVEYPLDASPQAAISGDIGAEGADEKATFRLRLRLPVVATAGGANDEPV